LNRREAIVGITWLAAAPGQAAAQRKLARVGVLHPGSSKEAASIQREPFERGLREQGWKPGANILIDYRYGEGDSSRLPRLAADLVRSGVDVIVARSNPATIAARNATSTIPIVMSATDDPVAAGFVASMSRPGGNITGIAVLLWEFDAKRLEVLKEAFPRISRVAVLANPNLDGPRYHEYVAVLRRMAVPLKLQLEMFEIGRTEDLEGAFARMRGSQIDAILVRGDAQVLDHHRSEVAALAAKYKLPAIYTWRFSVDAGGLMCYSTSLPDFHYRSATYVSRILRGEKAGELPIEQPRKFELVINLKAAKAIGIELPKAVLFRADELIQ
jgi:putative ABC transport system substrate-binding protein